MQGVTSSEDREDQGRTQSLNTLQRVGDRVSDSTLDAQMEPTQTHDLEQSLCCSPPAQLKLLVSREEGTIRKDTEGKSY